MAEVNIETAQTPRKRLTAPDLQWLALTVVLLFMLVTFIAPLLQVLFLSITDDGGNFTSAILKEVVKNSSLRHIILQTVCTAAEVSVCCLVIGYPAAYYLSQLKGRMATLTGIAILFPFLTSSLVRTFVFMVILGRTGLLNSLVKALGIPGAPFRLLFNQTGVVIGMTYVLLPYMLLSLIGTMRKIDPVLLNAARSLGAGPTTIFLSVYLPLSLPGVAAGTIITTILGFGYFVTPALMGGPSETMIAQLVEQRIAVMYDMHGAAALSLIMLAIVLAVYAIGARWLGLSRMMRPHG
ncbi:ABC transporter permease [Sodalis sp. dw_96]|uniref:ABC transporter permease n=1 Tax=Sodalis sp. dw_96 TaxID=2719794 RepID=UPI001BD364A8